MSSNLRARPSSTAAADPPPPPPPPPPPNAGRKILSQALTSTAYLSNLLPTGTLLAFQLLVPIFTHGGACDSGTGVTRPLTFFLLAGLALSCFLACFTDSITVAGKVYYGVATAKGLWLLDYPDPDGGGMPDLSKKRLRIIDGVHAALSVLVFGVVALRDRNVVSCLYPNPGPAAREVLDIVPVAVGMVCGLLFVAFPTKRHGVGFPVTPASV